MKRSRLSYDEWKCIISKDIFGKTVNSELFNGYIGLIDIKEVSQMLSNISSFIEYTKRCYEMIKKVRN